MKKLIALISAVAAAVYACAAIYAEENVYITRCFSSDECVTVYTSGDISDNVTARIAGVECKAINKGGICENNEKFETVFLIDSSKSMKNFSDEISAFLLDCIDGKPENEYYSIGLFGSGNTPEYIAENESDRYTLEKCVDDIEYDFKSTYIYDNLINALGSAEQESEAVFKRIVLITDGNENSARGITIDDVAEKLAEYPVPIFTVTLQTASKDNLEALKNISRLSRKSHGEDIRIKEGADASVASESAAVLEKSAKKVCRIDIVPEPQLLDGAVKALTLSDGSVSAGIDLRMAMSDRAVETNSISEITFATKETFETKETAETTETTETTAVSADEDTVDNRMLIIIIISAAAVIAAVTAVIIVLAVKKKNRPVSNEVQIPAEENDATFIIGSERSGATEMLIGDTPAPGRRTVILRDAADSMRTFEIQLSEEGAVIGRSSDMSNIVIDYDRSVSRRHCRIFIQGGKIKIEDLNSGNKTYLNGAEVSSPVVLNNADEIKIGRTKLIVTCGG